MVKKAVILCGGLATRFLPISKSIPKEMLHLLDKPILQIIIEDLKKAGIQQCLIVVGRNKESIQNHFDKNVELEERLKKTNKPELLALAQQPSELMDIYYKRQLEPRGTGSGVMLCENFAKDEPFVLMFGDELIFYKQQNVIEQLLDTFNKYQKSVIAVQGVPEADIHKYGIIKPQKLNATEFKVLDMVEKPHPKDAPSNLCYLGPAVLTKDIFEELKTCTLHEHKELVLTEAFVKQAQKGNLYARAIKGDRHDLGSKFGFVKANIVAALNHPDTKKQMKEYILSLSETLKK